MTRKSERAKGEHVKCELRSAKLQNGCVSGIFKMDGFPYFHVSFIVFEYTPLYSHAKNIIAHAFFCCPLLLAQESLSDGVISFFQFYYQA